MIGKSIAQYQILEKIGSGGMGEVYLAEDTKLNRRVALKFLPVHFSDEKSLKSRFISEARAAAKLNHPNIITIHEVGEYDGRPFFVMEYVEGKPLSEIIGSGGLPYERVVDIILQICEGLKEAHNAGIVHRDIKPANIIIDKAGRCRILDFGLAAVQSEERLTRTGALLGTVEYMSPEQLKSEKVDHRSDIFSVGILFFELLTGDLPFKSDYGPLTVYSILNESHYPLARFKPDLSIELQRIIDLSLEKVKESRYQDLSELIVDLKNIKSLSDESGESAKELSSAAPEGKKSIAIMYFEDFTGDENIKWLSRGLPHMLITDLEQSRQLNVVSYQRLFDILRLFGKEDSDTINIKTATSIARRARASRILTGSIYKSGDNIRIDYQLQEVNSGKLLGAGKVMGIDPLALADELGAEVRIKLDIEFIAEKEHKIADVTTNSPEAYRYYIEGIDFYNKQYPNEAKASFQKALEYDSTFAMAYCYLYKNSEYNSLVGDWRFLDKALAYSDKVTQREKLWIKSIELWESGKYDQAIDELRKLIALYPEDIKARQDLGYYYYYMNKPLESIDVLEAAIEIDSLYKDAYNQLAYSYSELGDYEKAIWAINKYISLAPDEPNPYDTRGDIYRDHGEISKAMESYEKAMEVRPDFLMSLYKLGELYILNKRYNEAEDIFVRICSTDDIEWRSRARSGLAYIPMYQGKFNRALEILDKGISGDELDRSSGFHCSQKHFLKALILNEIKETELAFEEIELAIEIYRRSFPNKRNNWLVYYPALLAENNDFIKAGEMAEAARKELEERDPHQMLFYWHALGCIEYYKGNLDAAELYFEKALEVYGILRFELRYMMGLTYLKDGKIEEAINEFNTRVKKPPFDSAWGSRGIPGYLVREVKSYYYLGIAYEKSGWTNKAIENYEEFLDIWKDADPGIEEIDDAKSRLAKLKQET